MRVCDFCKAEKPNELRPTFDVMLGDKECTVYVVSNTSPVSERDMCSTCAFQAILKLVEFDKQCDEKPVDPSDKRDIYGNVK